MILLSNLVLSRAARRAAVRSRWWAILALWHAVTRTAPRHYSGVLVRRTASRSFLVSYVIVEYALRHDTVRGAPLLARLGLPGRGPLALGVLP